MTLLDDNTKVALLTIPGTHDAATSTCSAMGKCQTLTIPQQLECGVRAFDLRPTMDNNTTLGNIYHSILDTEVSMAEVMTYFDNFLKAHPGEGIIVLMRYESERQIFGSISEDYYKSAMKNFLWDNKIYQSRMAAFNKSMTMKDLRCKKQVFDQQFSEKLDSADFGKLVLHIVIDKAVMRQRAAASLLGA